MIKVFITEDSPVVRGFLEYILNADPDIEVVGTAKDGAEAVELVPEKKPDVVTMDIHMPRMDGFEATRRIMESHPVPIVICSASWNPEEVDKTFRTMEAGAVAALEKPRGMGHPESAASIRELIRTIKAMSGIKVVRRWARTRGTAPKKEKTATPVKSKPIIIPGSIPQNLDIQVVAIGASTGGPMVLQTILAGLPKNFPVPILIVQHIAEGFLAGLGDWLHNTTGFKVHIAEQGETLLPATAYLAPDAIQMGVDRKRCIKLNDVDVENKLKPAVSYMFKSTAEMYGNQALGVLLTGMGKDGSAELGLFQKAGGVTIAQDEESSVVHGMPGEAIKMGNASIIASSADIPEKIMELI